MHQTGQRNMPPWACDLRWDDEVRHLMVAGVLALAVTGLFVVVRVRRAD
jgi:hypothetical protein